MTPDLHQLARDSAAAHLLQRAQEFDVLGLRDAAAAFRKEANRERVAKGRRDFPGVMTTRLKLAAEHLLSRLRDARYPFWTCDDAAARLAVTEFREAFEESQKAGLIPELPPGLQVLVAPPGH